MRAWIGLILLLGGCSGVEGRRTGWGGNDAIGGAGPHGCVEVGGGELQAGLTLGLGGGNVTVTDVQHQGGDAVGFTIAATAAQVFFIVTTDDVSCSDGDSFLSKAPISRVDFCSGASGCL